LPGDKTGSPCNHFAARIKKIRAERSNFFKVELLWTARRRMPDAPGKTDFPSGTPLAAFRRIKTGPAQAATPSAGVS